MISRTTFYFSRTLNRKFYSPDGKPLGKVKDLLIELSGSRPRVLAMKVKIKGKERILDFAQFELIKAVTQYVIRCNELVDFQIPETSHSIFIAESVLDRQIVDINGRKLERVNDIRLVIISSGIYVIAVDVGLEGLLRRIGISHQIKTFLSWFNLTLPSDYILWDDVETIDAMRAGIRLSTPYSKLHTLHPSDLADIIEDMDRKTQINVFSALNEEKAADVLEELEDKTMKDITEYFEGEPFTLESESSYEIKLRKVGHGKFLYRLPFGGKVYSINGMSTVIDDDCMSKENNESLKYVILRENGKLYNRWDDLGSLIF